ncbi:hypothetical protein LTS18_004322, partial [Coniosporium uncinatum]
MKFGLTEAESTMDTEYDVPVAGSGVAALEGEQSVVGAPVPKTPKTPKTPKKRGAAEGDETTPSKKTKQ